MLIAPIVSLCVALAAAAPPSGPTMAREDTMTTEVPPILVSAPRVTLDEILDRVARGEARRDSMLHDQTFVATFRLVKVGRDGKTELIKETLARVYKQRPDKVRSVVLRDWNKKEDDKKNVELSFRSDMSEDIVNFAFRPEARREFRYEITGRDVVNDHLIYRIAFDPRSPLDPSMPSGLVWVDTNDFVIVRQEVSFKRSPVPIFIKGVDRMVIERRHEDGHWVLARVLLRASMTLSLPMVGKSFDMTLRFDHYAINKGINGAIFDGAQP